jgi:hypothetical protein
MTKQEQKQLILLIGAFLLLVYLAFSGWISLDIENDSMIIRRHNWPFQQKVVFQRPLFQISEAVLKQNIYLKTGKGLASSDGVFLMLNESSSFEIPVPGSGQTIYDKYFDARLLFEAIQKGLNEKCLHYQFWTRRTVCLGLSLFPALLIIIGSFRIHLFTRRNNKQIARLIICFCCFPIPSSAIIFTPFFFDFGERTEIERPVLTATLRNNGERTVHVTDVIRTCVCANLELSTTNLPPGGAAEVRCTLDPNVFSGPFLKTFFIKTDDPATPSITVPIRGSVRQLWEVSPDKWYQLRAGETNAVLRVKAAPDAPALVRTEILGPAGASFELRPAGEREFDAVFAPGDQPRGQHHWTVNLYPEGAETPALGLHLGKQVGEHWKCVPARLRAPVNGRDFVADLLVKPADGKDLSADVDPAAITLSPVWDHVSIEPLGPPTWRGIPLRLTVGAEMVSSWEFPKTFYLTIPDHGVASVYFEKIVPATEPETEQTGETK